jgi:hypothetical protein
MENAYVTLDISEPIAKEKCIVKLLKQPQMEGNQFVSFVVKQFYCLFLVAFLAKKGIRVIAAKV